MTDEELDAARAHEAERLWTAEQAYKESHHYTAWCAKRSARLAREGWKPTDPLLVKAREIVAEIWDDQGSTIWAKHTREGVRDDQVEVRIALAALKERP